MSHAHKKSSIYGYEVEAEYGGDPGDMAADLMGRQSSFGSSSFGDIFSDLTNSIEGAVGDPGQDLKSLQGMVSNPQQLINSLGSAISKDANFFGGLANDVSNAASSAWNGVSGIVGNLPMAQQIASAIQAAANSDIGKQVLTVATGALYMTAAPIIGPIALMTFAAPGLLQGDKFPQAWLQGFVGQTQRALKALSGGNVNLDVLPDDIKQQVYNLSSQITGQVANAGQFLQTLGPDPNSQLGALAKQFGLPDPSSITPQMLASKLGIREDAAAATLSNALSKLPGSVSDAATQAYSRMSFDPKTGKQVTNYAANARVLANAGIAEEKKVPALAAGRALGNRSGYYTSGYDAGVGSVLAQMSDADAGAIHDFLQAGGKAVAGQDFGHLVPAPPVSTGFHGGSRGKAAFGTVGGPNAPAAPTGRAQGVDPGTELSQGFLAGRAIATGMKSKLAADIQNDAGLFAFTKAGNALMHGAALTSMTAAQRAALAQNTITNPNAKAGAVAAIQSIAADKLSWWGEFKRWLGFDAEAPAKK